MKYKRRIISAAVCAAIALSSLAAVFSLAPAALADTAGGPRQMEYLDRGTVAVKVDNGVYLSWRLLGTEEYDQGFDIYRTTDTGETTCIEENYTDTTNYSYAGGKETDKYTVVPTGVDVSEGKAAEVWAQNYLTIPIDRPAAVTLADGNTYEYTANDASVGDLDGDGDYEIILKWDCN